MQVVTLDLIDPGEQDIEIIGDAEVAAGHPVRTAAGQREDQAGRLFRVGATAGRELVTYPAVDMAFRRLLAGFAPQRDLGETDGQQAGSTLNTDTPYGRVSSASVSVSFTSAAFEAA